MDLLWEARKNGNKIDEVFGFIIYVNDDANNQDRDDWEKMML